jgi:predicted PurR-regulated permease PerM
MILLITATVAALYLGRDVFIPLALAILFSFALGPLVTRLHRLGIGRVPAVLTVIAMVVMLLVGFGALVASQLAHLADGLPTYEANLRAKAQALASAAPGGNIVDRAADLLRNIGEDIEQVTEGQIASGSAETAAATAASQPRPIPVEIHEPPPPPIQALSGLLGPLLAPIATAGVAVVFVIFVLLQREDLRDRLIRLFGATDVHRSTEAITDAAKRIGRYLLMQLVINVTYGVPVGIGLWLIGVPNALLWGILATVLRFIPYLGPVLAATLPIALSLAVDPGWTTPLLTVSLFVTLELFSNNVMEPWLYGASTGLSPLAIIVAAVFWTTLWGPVGLLLSTPLTVCLVVLGRHVPQLNFIEVLLGDAPVLTPEVKFYQRLLADDPIDAEELAQEQLEEQPLAEVYEATLMPALAMAEQDRVRGALERSRAQAMSEAAQGIVDRLAEDTDDAKEKPAVAQPAVAGNVLCLGGRTGFDACFAAMLAHLLHGRGMAARPGSLSAGLPTADELTAADLVCLCYVDPGATRHARRLIQRLRARRDTPVPVVLCMWQLPTEAAERALAVAGADRMARSLRGAMDVVLELTGPAEQRPPPAATREPAATPTALGAVST